MEDTKLALVRAQLVERGVTTVNDAAIARELQAQEGHVGRAVNRLDNRQQAQPLALIIALALQSHHPHP